MCGERRVGWDSVLLDGASSGLIIIWENRRICGEGVAKSQRILAVKMRSLGEDFTWVVAIVYVPNGERERSIFGFPLSFLVFVVSSLVHCVQLFFKKNVFHMQSLYCVHDAYCLQ